MSLLPNFQNGIDRISVFREGCGKEGVIFFQQGLQFLHKKITFDIFNDKKSLQGATRNLICSRKDAI